MSKPEMPYRLVVALDQRYGEYKWLLHSRKIDPEDQDVTIIEMDKPANVTLYFNNRTGKLDTTRDEKSPVEELKAITVRTIASLSANELAQLVTVVRGKDNPQAYGWYRKVAHLFDKEGKPIPKVHSHVKAAIEMYYIQLEE